ncbi:hypothetical protein B296_00057499, partial [Ensete ventricosum]
YSTTHCLLRSLVEHSCINPKSLAFGYLDEKPIDTGLMKFLSLCPFALSWYLEFVFAFSTSSAPFRLILSLFESKGSMTPQKSHLYIPWCCQAHGPTICCLASASLPSQSVDPPLRHYGAPLKQSNSSAALIILLYNQVPSMGLTGRSYIPVFQIPKEKMKEVKRPPL